MTTLYKLTDEHGQTHGKTQWGEGVEVVTDGKGDLCGPGFTHWYTDPLLAVLLNPIHANFKNPQLWEGEGDVAKTDHGLKVGCTRGKTIRRIPLLEVTTTQRIAFGILCAMAVCSDPDFQDWGRKWLSGGDRSAKAAWAAWAAVRAAAANAANAANAAIRAAANAANAAWAAANAAWAAWAAWSADAAWAAAKPLDLIAIARKAMEVT